MTLTTVAPIHSLDTVVPASAEVECQSMRHEIDALDAQILDLVRRRTELTQRTAQTRARIGLPKTTQHDEMGVLRTYEAELGRDGTSLALTLLRLGRTRP